jgi:phage shock protein C
MAPRSLRDVP